jgi:hypothetical protein
MILGTANILPPAQIVVPSPKFFTPMTILGISPWPPGARPYAIHLNRVRWSFRMQRSITTKSPARRAFSAAFS